MDNNELDKALKEKLKGKINAPKELEEKIKMKVEEQKFEKLKSMNTQGKSNKSKHRVLKSLMSVAAVLLIVFVVGIKLDFLSLNNKEVTIVTIKAIEPTKAQSGIIANDSEFIIYTDGEKSNKESVQRSIYIEPALDYSIEKINNEQYKLKFKQNIPDNTIVKLQYIKNKIAEDSWAYQTSNRLSVSGTYPINNSDGVSKSSVIEVEFSYANVEDFEKNVTITPEIEGAWDHIGNIWRFTPKAELKENQKYTIKVGKGVKSENQTLENDYIFSFTVNTEDSITHKYTYSSISIGNIITNKPDEFVKIHYNYNSGYPSNEKISKIEISKFSTIDEFIEYVKNRKLC